MIDFSGFYRHLEATNLSPCLDWLPRGVHERIFNANNGNLPRWLDALAQLPCIPCSSLDCDADTVSIGAREDCDDETREQLRQVLQSLMPWRKGPYDVFGIHIDSEWRSDWKWRRLQDHIAPLTGRLVLDVGCGSGYHLWRMLGAGAHLAMGIDPSLLYVCQFQALRYYAGLQSLAVLPFKSEDLAGRIGGFDTVFSMGVLYHRRTPLAHLRELQQFLRPGGEMVLETLVIDGAEGDVLVPEGRYAKMNNVWYIPSPAELMLQLSRLGFADIRLVDINRTSCEEQRRSDWMQFESLEDFLGEDPATTIEGYPAPTRATLVATV